MAIVQGAGYPNPDHSHFRSTEIWQTAVPDKYATTGWLGRYLDAANLPRDNLFNAVAVSPVLPEALIAERVDVPAIDGVRGYGLTSDHNKTERGAFAAFASDTRAPFSSPYLPLVAMIEDHAERGASELPKLVSGYTTARRIRQRRSAAASRSRPRSSAAVSGRACCTCSTAPSTRMSVKRLRRIGF